MKNYCNTKMHSSITVKRFLQYLGKYTFMKRATRSFWKVLRQINAYVLNKWLLNLQCAYLNTQGSSPSGTPLKRIDDGKFFDIVMRFLFILRTIVQYFFVLGKSIFLHFRSISNKLKKVVSIRVEMCIKFSIY
ncbi:hypothetical protein T09_1628 [Trichinella sp. T9]|nr:hypothetical protein T09_1628 [Trichinella sp. T9]